MWITYYLHFFSLIYTGFCFTPSERVLSLNLSIPAKDLGLPSLPIFSAVAPFIFSGFLESLDTKRMVFYPDMCVYKNFDHTFCLFPSGPFFAPHARFEGRFFHHTILSSSPLAFLKDLWPKLCSDFLLLASSTRVLGALPIPNLPPPWLRTRRTPGLVLWFVAYCIFVLRPSLYAAFSQLPPS